ncbi:MAG: ParB N-terminal domain-containing protein, partial [Thermoanaerobaculia bacterium]
PTHSTLSPVGTKKTAGKPRRPRRKRPETPIGLAPGELQAEPPREIAALAERARADGGCVLASYREPVGGHWMLLAALPVDRVEPTPFQREPSKTHVEKIARVVEKVGRFLDPVILSPAPQGGYWTPNGNHRLQALKKLNARTVVGLLVPEPELCHQILALNTEKGYNLREKARGVLSLLRTLAGEGTEWANRTEESLAFELEEAALVTLGLAYEARPRFSGGAYHSLLRRIDGFLDQKLGKALETRKERAGRVLAVDDRVGAIVEALKARGFQSPYLRAFAVARVNPIRFHKGEPPPFDETLERMLRAAEKFDAAKIKESDIARAGGPPPEAEG